MTLKFLNIDVDVCYFLMISDVTRRSQIDVSWISGMHVLSRKDELNFVLYLIYPCLIYLNDLLFNTMHDDLLITWHEILTLNLCNNCDNGTFIKNDELDFWSVSTTLLLVYAYILSFSILFA